MHNSSCICNLSVAARSSNAFQGDERLRAGQRKSGCCIALKIIQSVRYTYWLFVYSHSDFCKDRRPCDKLNRAVDCDFKFHFDLLRWAILSGQSDRYFLISDL